MKFGLSLKFGLSKRLSERLILIQKVKSPNVARAEAYLRAKFHLDPSIHLATVHQRCRQTTV